ncbi:MAG: class I SAM-dependent methyltransferase [Calditrichaeota bacterium]|nr:MAG: class I SAM-dependent methyltransferase [Calditrichota bacterium]
MWEQRYSGSEYVYGQEPNQFLASVLAFLPRGRALCLAEGEGRNAVFLARQGYQVTAVDFAVAGLKKAARLARQNRVHLNLIAADLTRFPIKPGSWEVIVSIFGHFYPEDRRKIHRQVVEGLVPGGMFVLEAYTPKQLAYRTGGPPVRELMMEAADLEKELAGLEFLILRETERAVVEGTHHRGWAAVVQVLARKPEQG